MRGGVEDDGETGYFCGLDLRLAGQPIVDARHIYNVELVSDRAIPSVVKILLAAAAGLDGLEADVARFFAQLDG